MIANAPKLRGQPWTAADVNALMRGINASTVAGGAGMNVGAVTGGRTVSLAPKAEMREGAIHVKHVGSAAVTAPRFGVVELHTALAGGSGPLIVEGRRCTHPGWYKLGILHEGVAHNGVAWAQIEGVFPVLYICDIGETIDSGNRMSPVCDKAIVNSAGNLARYLCNEFDLGAFEMLSDQMMISDGSQPDPMVTGYDVRLGVVTFCPDYTDGDHGWWIVEDTKDEASGDKIAKHVRTLEIGDGLSTEYFGNGVLRVHCDCV